ncbi:hypothetical protein, partial [Zunongwangia sp. H14]|uniref:hypothetical protein n=1 Tax=Zunongwangia sp. H14 TaxID=3240792 RepID=UPI0035651FD7
RACLLRLIFLTENQAHHRTVFIRDVVANLMKPIMRLIQLLFLLIPITSFSQPTDKEIAEHYETKDFDVAIFPKNDGELIGGLRFTPTKVQVDRAENALIENLEELNHELENQEGTRHRPIIHKHLDKYKRQYFGLIDENGDKILYIKALWYKHEASEDWLQRLIDVHGGGSFFWNIEYNLIKKKLTNLSVNGYS